MIDLRSDTVTKPTEAMRKVLASAEVGDDIYGDDPSINRLEAWAAERHGFEAALFATSGTQTNLLGLIAQCQRGDEYIVGLEAHTYKYEGGGAAVLGSIQPQPIPMNAFGCLDADAVEAVIKPEDPHFARSKLVTVENTQHGRVLPQTQIDDLRALCQRHGLIFHLDGARAYNAAVKLNIDIAQLLQPFDSASICLSKGLGAPVGSLLLGSADMIKEARKWRKMLGGGWRQGGILAAAAHHALEHHVELLRQDHEHAALLAGLLEESAALRVNQDWLQTNMVWCELSEVDTDKLTSLAKEAGLLISPRGNSMRLVTHLNLTRDDIERAAQIINQSMHALAS